eukprot:1011_1
MARRRNNNFVDLVISPLDECSYTSYSSFFQETEPQTVSPDTPVSPVDKWSNKWSDIQLQGESSFKSVQSFKKEWKTLKQVGWGGQASIFHVNPLIDAPKCTKMVEYVAKIIYFTDETVYPSAEDRQHAVRTVMDEYIFVVQTQLLNYTDFYYDTVHYYKAIIVMEKLSHCLSHKRDGNWKGIYCIKKIARDIAYNIKRLHDLHYAHLDIKKENIMYNDRAKTWQLIDYGFMKYIDPFEGHIKVQKFIGTKRWTAPEIALLSEMEYCEMCVENVVSHKCDIYSYGLVLLNIALGRYHYGVFEKCNWMGMREMEYLKKLNTQKGNDMLRQYLVSLNKNEVIDHDLYALLSQVLVYDPRKRPSIDGILCMEYLTT